MSQTLFGHIANATSRGAGKPGAPILAVAAVVIWAAIGPWFRYSETWQLFINTGTTIVTILMVFLIQHSQNCDSSAVHINLDEIIAALKHADNKILDMENASVEELNELRASYKLLAENARREMPRGQQGKVGAAERV